MEVVPPSTALAALAGAVARDALADAVDAAELLDVEIAAHRVSPEPSFRPTTEPGAQQPGLVRTLVLVLVLADIALPALHPARRVVFLKGTQMGACLSIDTMFGERGER
jgi:hypothetical protein